MGGTWLGFGRPEPFIPPPRQSIIVLQHEIFVFFPRLLSDEKECRCFLPLCVPTRAKNLKHGTKKLSSLTDKGEDIYL